MDEEEAEDKVELDTLLARLRPFQREAFTFATGKSLSNHEDDGTISKSKGCRILIADEMGLGKTVTSLAIMLAYKSEWPLLILCPASLRYTWPTEIEKFCPKLPHSAVYVVRGFDDCDFHSNPNKRSKIKIVVATYSLLQNRSAAARALQQFDFKCVIADESHNLKEKKSQRCALAMPILIKARHLLLLSGTPALAKPVELWAQLHCISKDLFGAYSHFTKRYCNARYTRFGFDCTGLSNADELHKKLKTIMIRRLKADVLTELPAKQRSMVPVKINNSKNVKECKDIIARLNESRAAVDSLVGEDASDANFEARKLLMQAYQASGCGKAQAVADYVLDWLRGCGTQKVLVFAHHKEVLDTIEDAVSKAFKGVGHIRIDGAVSPADRASRVKKFQTKPQIRLALLSVTAAGVGLTLTAASSVIFAELHWTPGVLAQAEDRCHRIGQTNAVNVMYCVCKDTEMSVDLSLWKMLGRKVNNLGRMIDGERGAGMNASETENNESSDQELASFFADSLSHDITSNKLTVPVKGSIQSFFKKQSSNQEATGTHKTSSSILGTSKTQVKNKITPGRKRPLESSQSTSSTIHQDASWDCSICTYNNESEPMSCRMCGAKKCKNSEPTTLERKRQIVSSQSTTYSSAWDCSICTFKNKSGPLSCNMCGAKRAMRSDKALLGKESRSFRPSPFNRSRDCESASYNSPCAIDLTAGRTSLNRCKPKASTRIASIHKIHASQSSVIEILDDSDDDIINAVQPTRMVTTKQIKRKRDCLINAPKCNPNQKDSLSFSVSKNSGRIAVHNANNNESLMVNFDVGDIVNDDADLERIGRQIKRCTSGRFTPQVSFDKLAIRSIARDISKNNSVGVIFDFEKLCIEIESFLTNYTALRAVEKKAIKDLGIPIQSSSIHATLRKMIKSKLHPQSTERYMGGCYERALERSAASQANEHDDKVLSGNACAWCGGNFPDVSFCEGVESTYCSQECAEEGRIRRGGMYASTRIRTQVFSLEHGICQGCGIDANALFLRIKALPPAQRLSALMGVNWRLPKTQKSLSRLLQKPKEGDFWQADHMYAVSEGGGDCGLENLRTLCTPCHQVETNRLRSRLRLRGPPAGNVSGCTHEDKSANCTDIRKFMSR